MATYRPGSMGAADAKSSKTIKIVAGIIYLAILALLFVIPNDLKDFANRASGLANAFGALLIGGSYYLVYNSDRQTSSTYWYWIGAAILLGLGIAAACGFNFDYFGIDK